MRSTTRPSTMKYLITNTTQSLLSNKPPELRKMIRQSLLTSQMSLFLPTKPKTKKTKMKALHTGVKAFINATLPTPRMFSHDSQDSFHSDLASFTAGSGTDISSLPSKDKKKSKLRKMFGIFTGKSRSREELHPSKQRSSSLSSEPSELSLKDGTSRGEIALSSHPEQTFKWGKEKTLVRSALSHSPVELFEKHLTLEEDNLVQDTTGHLPPYGLPIGLFFCHQKFFILS
jgi:hypothetical protein